MLIEALQPLHIRRATGDLHLRPGYPIELPDDEAEKLLRKAGDKVRSHFTIEPAMKHDGSSLSPVYWETGAGKILGPATPEFWARDGDTFHISVTFKEQIYWINADRLRSQKAFDAQFPRELNRREFIGRR